MFLIHKFEKSQSFYCAVSDRQEKNVFFGNAMSELFWLELKSRNVKFVIKFGYHILTIYYDWELNKLFVGTFYKKTAVVFEVQALMAGEYGTSYVFQ